MANEWLELALTMGETLEESYALEEALGLIDRATTKLQALSQVLRAISLGATYEAAADAYADPEPLGVHPATLLQDARLDIRRRSALQSQAMGVFRLCCTGMDPDYDAVIAERLRIDRHDADENAAQALLMLRTAASFAKAAIDAVDLAAALPHGIPLRHAWLMAAEQMENVAINEVTTARNHVVTMRDALALLLLDSLPFLGIR